MQAHIEREFPGLYFDPRRWTTIDGFMPWQLFLGYAKALFPLWAMERLKMAAAIGLVMADEKSGPRLWRATTNEAYPVTGEE